MSIRKKVLLNFLENHVSNVFFLKICYVHKKFHDIRFMAKYNSVLKKINYFWYEDQLP